MAGKAEGRFYVYRVSDDAGQSLYIGKGFGRRARCQQTRFGRPVEIVERFKSEDAAYKRERELIALESPVFNKAKGGNGSRCTAKIKRTPGWVVEMEAFGTKKWAARALLAKGDEALGRYLSPDNIAALKNAYATL